MKFPEKLGPAIDLLYSLREKRQAIQRQADKIDAVETELEQHLFKKFKKSELEGGKGSRASASVSKKDYGTLKDFAALMKHIKRTGEFDLLQRRLNSKACAERWALGKSIPGVEIFTKVTLSLHKVKGKK